MKSLTIAVALLILAPAVVAPAAAQEPRNWTRRGRPGVSPICRAPTRTAPSRRSSGPRTSRAASSSRKRKWPRSRSARRSRAATRAASKGTRGDVERAYNDFWWDRGTKVTTPRTSLVIDPADGRVPALTEEAKAARGRRREAAGVSRRRRERTRNRHLARSQHLRALHHPRHARRDEPDRLQQQLPDHAEPRIRRHPDRDAGRSARDPDRRPAARSIESIRQWMGALGRHGGKATRWWSTRRTSPTRCSTAAPPRICTSSSASRVSAPATDRLSRHRRSIRRTFTKPWTLAIPYVNTGEDHVRVRLPRRELRHGRHSERSA